MTFVAHVLLQAPMPQNLQHLKTIHTNMRAAFVADLYADRIPFPPLVWGSGISGNLIKELADVLSSHGVPKENAESRASQAIRMIGSEQIRGALAQKAPWKQLKALANNVKFKFVLPTELQQTIESNKGKQVGGASKPSKPSLHPEPVQIDPSKLQVIDGTFRCQGQVMPQIGLNQIGPVSMGFVVCSLSDAELYLKNAKQVSSEPLALLVLRSKDMACTTALPHAEIVVPCRCTIDQEPILIDATMVQLGSAHIDKHVGSSTVTFESPEVATVKFLVYRDEFPEDWSAFCHAPIKGLHRMFPILRRCHTEGCQCQGWHNKESLPIHEPILDLWRRQFLKLNFKPCEVSAAELFSVCMRVPCCLLPTLLAASGIDGAYTEPRSADGKEILADYMIVWTPRLALKDLLHFKQTTPAVLGLVRINERRGVRTLANQAQSVHQLIKPDALFLPPGVRTQYVVGPWPYGMDRLGISKVLKQAGWEAKPLQPALPSPGRGNMWMVQSVMDPPVSIISTSQGEILISKHKPEGATKPPAALPVAAPSTLALCGSTVTKSGADPWLQTDPWKSYQPSGGVQQMPVNEGIRQMEDRIQSTVMSKLSNNMEQDDLPDRIQVLESQMQHMMGKQTAMETQFHEFTGQQSAQLTTMQTQLNAQGQMIHGHIESQNQSIQAMFESQMAQIRNLLAKRPREDGE